MNTNIFKNEICSYCKNNKNCSKDKIEHIENDTILYKNKYNNKIINQYVLENKMETLKCDNYKQRRF